jgi:hypothetical protein
MWLALHVTVSQIRHFLAKPPPSSGNATLAYNRAAESLGYDLSPPFWAALCYRVFCGGAETKTAGRKLQGLKKKNQSHVTRKWLGAVFPEFRFIPWLLCDLGDNFKHLRELNQILYKKQLAPKQGLRLGEPLCGR